MNARGAVVLLLFLADIGLGRAQELPSGSGPVPDLRRGANGQLEAVPRVPGARETPVRRSPTPALVPPSSVQPTRGSSPAPVRAAAPPLPRGPSRPVIEVRPGTPRLPDTAPRGTAVAYYSVRMSDGSPFAGIVRFGPPHYDDNGRFALEGNSIVVNPNGPGIGPNKTTVTNHITLEAITESRAGR
jgi:hypothetical protein